jgi:hypothetical protein
MPKVSKSVHFRNEEQVLEAYRNRDVPAFAVWQDKQFLFKYEGDSIEDGETQLKSWVDMLAQNQSSAIYTVCVYEDWEAGTKIKDTTPYDGSFNFRLYDNPSGYLPPQQYVQYQQQGGSLKVLLDKMSAQQQEIERLKSVIDQGGEGDEEDNALGIVGKLLEHPVLGPALQPLIQRLAGGIADVVLGKDEGEGVPAQVRRISGVAIENGDARLVSAIERLQKQVDDLPALLEKLALLAEKKPTQFLFYKQMLQSMKV